MKFIIAPSFLLYSLTSLAGVKATFLCSAINGCAPLSVNVTDASKGRITSRYWGFGNNNTSTLSTSSAQYVTPGNYTITLVVSDGINMDSSSQTITVFSPPAAYFKSDLFTACPQQIIHFTNQTQAGSAPITHLSWGLGNGVTYSENNISYRYPAAGTYDVTLVARDENGCVSSTKKSIEVKNLKADFSVSQVTTSAGKAITFMNQSSKSGTIWHWDFGDGTSSDMENPTKVYEHPGVYSVTFANKEGVCGAAATYIDYIKVNQESSRAITADK